MLVASWTGAEAWLATPGKPAPPVGLGEWE